MLTDSMQVMAIVPPTLMVLVGILTNNARLSDFRGDMNTRLSDLRAEMNHRFDEVDEKLGLLAKVWIQSLPGSARK